MDRRNILHAGDAFGLAALSPSLWAVSKIKLGAHAAWLVVDMPNCLVEGGTLAVKGGGDVVPIINRLVGAFENIVDTQDWQTPEHASFASSDPGKKRSETIKLSYSAQVMWSDHCQQGTKDAALNKNLDLPTAQLIIRKGFHKDMDSYSEFEETDRKTPTGLAAYLKQRGIKSVFVTGLATDFCVASTAMDARKRGFDVDVIEDATRAIDLNSSLAAAWKQIPTKGVKRIHSADICVV